MIRIIPFLIIFCLTAFSCRSQQTPEKFEADDLGILVEKFDSLNKDENRYNLNNKIYTVGKTFTFSYYYVDKEGTKLLMTKDKRNNDDWTFEKMDKKDSNSISRIILTVNPGLSPFIEHLPDYNQTVITYSFQLFNDRFWNNEMTGVIENQKNLWMHPPRTAFFKILEINPFPYIKEPIEVGNRWSWKLAFGDHWADKRWLSWKGSNENTYTYEITEKVTLQTTLGDLNCYVVEGKATSQLGTTKLKSHFNTKFGFVKFDYTNIDGTKTVIELERVE